MNSINLKILDSGNTKPSTSAYPERASTDDSTDEKPVCALQ